MADLETGVHSALQHAHAGRSGELVQALHEKPTADDEAALANLVEDAVQLLHALTHVLPQASKDLIFAKKEVSMLAKTLENVFNVFDDQGPKIFTEISEMYAEVWELYYVSMLVLPCGLLFYAFWAGGFFGGPGQKVNRSLDKPQNILAK